MKRGFTLIELLAVIVILAIIALIAVPVVLNIINDSKESSTKRSIDLYINSVKTSVTKESMNPNFPKGEITCTILNEQSEGTEYDKDDLICIEDNNENVSSYVKIDIKGETPINGEIKLNNGKIIEDKTWLEMSNNIFYRYENNAIIKLTEDEINNLTSRLPKEYQEVEYIESTGTQYINTGIYTTIDKQNSYKLDFTAINSNGWTGVNGSMQLNIVSNNTRKEYFVEYNGNTGVEKIYTDSILTKENNWGRGNWLGRIFVGILSNYNSCCGINGYIHEFEVNENNELVRNLIPCYSKTTVIDVNGVEQPKDTIGMYDLVEGKFYTNQGTGEFIKGPDVN